MRLGVAAGRLGLTPACTEAEIKTAYKKKALVHHPDRNGGDRQHEARLNRVVEAYQLLRKSGAFVSGAK